VKLANEKARPDPPGLFDSMNMLSCGMAVSLLRGPSIVSLEFDPEDQAAVKHAIREIFGEPRVTPGVIASNVRIDGEDFTYQNEWDDPCLITRTDRGAEILQAVADKLGQSGE
jgi:hypothetical protein